jgi:hypothetical protein
MSCAICCASRRRTSTGSRNHSPGGTPGDPGVLLGCRLDLASAALELRISGSKHGAHVIRQRQKRAH